MAARSILAPFDAVATSAGAGSPGFNVGRGAVVDDSTAALVGVALGEAVAVGSGVGVVGGLGVGVGGSLHATSASDATTNEAAARRDASDMARIVLALRRCVVDLDRDRVVVYFADPLGFGAGGLAEAGGLGA